MDAPQEPTPRPLAELVLTKQLNPKLTCSVFYHHVVIGSKMFPVWCYITKGMMEYEQPEVTFTLKLDSAEEEKVKQEDKEKLIPTKPFLIFSALFAGVSQGKLFGEGHIQDFAGFGFLRDTIAGATFQIADEKGLPEGSFDPKLPYLSMITLFADEMKMTKACGVTRLMTLLGKQHDYYPCPFWSDRDRASTLPVNMSYDGVLFQSSHIKIAGTSCHVSQVDKKVTILFPKSGRDKLTQTLAKITPDKIVILEMSFDPMIDNMVVYQPAGSSSLETMQVLTRANSEGKMIGGSFIGFVPEQTEDESTLYEDGFMVMLTDGSWGLLRKCLASGTNCLIQSATPEGLNAEVKWWDDLGDDEDDHKPATYCLIAREMTPKMFLLTAKDVLEKHVSHEEFTTWGHNLTGFIQKYLQQPDILAQLPGVADVVLQVDLWADKKMEVKIGYKPSDVKVDPQFKFKIGELLDTFESIKVKGNIKFQLYFPISK